MIWHKINSFPYFLAEVLGFTMYSGGCVKSTMMVEEECDQSTDCMTYERICITEDFPRLGKVTSCQCKTDLCNGSSQLESRTTTWIATTISLVTAVLLRN